MGERLVNSSSALKTHRSLIWQQAIIYDFYSCRVPKGPTVRGAFE